MSASSPFRSHLLQQWTANSRRSPIAVQQWLQKETIHEEEEANRSSKTSPSSRQSRQVSRRSFHNSARRQDSLDLSSVDTSPSSASIALSATSWKNGTSIGLSDGQQSKKSDRRLFDVVLPRNVAMNKHSVASASPSLKSNIFGSVGEITSTSSKTGEKKDTRQHDLNTAIHRAVKLSKTNRLYKDRMATKSTEGGKPFTFRKLLAMSRSGRKLVDICYEFTLRTTGDDALAREERKSWSEVPVFLVAIVHDNQAKTTAEGKGDFYKVLGYSPPTTEEQLEDVRFIDSLYLLVLCLLCKSYNIAYCWDNTHQYSFLFVCTVCECLCGSTNHH